jgi:serine/threonine protein kinase/tetratricopeptide (TPR) repeat protein
MILCPGTRLSHYELIERIGSGGMGDVWKARDTRLGRDVAVKVLPPGSADSADKRARFNREARAIAALNHPNIVTVYSVEEADDLHFITMELVSGCSLEALLPAGGFELARFLDIAIPLSEAIAFAHDHRIVHRDLKAANVMVTDNGRVKVLDFGLAKLAATEGTGTALTQDGVVMGTLPYMAPEQIQGAAVDHRADIFSLGVLLYEMAAGSRPFTGDNSPALMYSLLEETPRPLTEIRPDLPASLGDVIDRCLAKRPEQRYATCREVHDDLDALRRGTDTVSVPHSSRADTSIAVLPFDNMSPDPSDEFFSDGITEEIINALGHLQGVRVAARTSSFAFKGKREDLRGVGEKLGVKTLLEGSVRKAGSKLRITAQLVNAADGYHLWSERYDRELTDVFAIQDEIAGAIAAKLKVELVRRRSERALRAGPRNMEAYQLFLKGRVLHTRRGGSLMESRKCFEQAIALDPDMADAHALLADTYRLMAVYGMRPAMEMMPRSRVEAEKALASDPNQVEGLTTLAGIYAHYDRDLDLAMPLWERVLEIDPRHVRTLMERAINIALMRPRDRREAVHDARLATEIDSLNAWVTGMYAFVLAFDDQNDRAIETARHATELDGQNFMAHWSLVATLMHAGELESGLAAAEPALAMSGRHPYILTAVASAHAALGHTDKAEAVYQELLSRSQTGYVGHSWLAAAAASAGRMEVAVRHAAQAVAEKDASLVFVHDLPDWEAFRADPERMKIFAGRP